MLPILDDIKLLVTKKDLWDLLFQFIITILGIIFGELGNRVVLFSDEFTQKKRFKKAIQSVFIKKDTQFGKILLLASLCIGSCFLFQYTGQINLALFFKDVDFRICSVVAFVWFCFRMFKVFNNSVEDMETLEQTNALLGPGLAANYWASFLMWALKADIRQKMEETLCSMRMLMSANVEKDGTRNPQVGANYRSFDKFIILLPDDCHLKIRDERILKQEFIFKEVPELNDGASKCTFELEFELEAIQKRKPMKQTVYWIYESPEYEKESSGEDKEKKKNAKKILVLFDFPQLVQSAMGPDRGWDENDRPGARKKNIQAFKKTLKDLMNPAEYKQFERNVVFLQFPKREKKPMSAVIREKIKEVEDERVCSSSSGAESEA